jgi:hypothetical protein
MSFFIKGHPMIRALIFPLPRFHLQEDRKMEHEIVHISMYLFYFLLNAKKHFRGLNSLWGRSLLDVSDYKYDTHNFFFRKPNMETNNLDRCCFLCSTK